MTKPPTLFDAVAGFVGLIVAGYGRVLDEGAPDMPVRVIIGDAYETEMTLADLQALDRAYQAAFEAREKRAERKARGTLI